MSTATAVKLNDEQARLLNRLYDLKRAGVTTPPLNDMPQHRIDLRAVVVPLWVDHRFITAHDRGHGFEIEPIAGVNALTIRVATLRLTAAGEGWVEDNPRNALLRRTHAILGRMTLRRAYQHVDNVAEARKLVHEVLHDGYVSLHHAENREEVARFIVTLTRIGLLDPDNYILLPTPKIRKVLGS